ncbi:hypothetical protein SAMN00768000_1577 [Sulfobacillus thermosulfidooxidans DSM 9293]|uniref:Uncharacterized protein n=1 Tax=Sulfobacillus thermosulfidooxidans (strain DSM 9293 / VKM B-1269 / AT-1) TaxID=929705 RepID=A0A1W1WE29_SULTA|nr:hypothetical protein SAMN00768000_1577 [Sulfobacillus thermosulfidooxidans DSM 9293]
MKPKSQGSKEKVKEDGEGPFGPSVLLDTRSFLCSY